jgi:hypothetical protein
MEGKNKYIQRYPEKDLVKILKESAYHSSEWEETDPEDDWPIIIQPETVVDETTIVEATNKKKTTSAYIYEKWWRSSAVCIHSTIFLFIKHINANFIYFI